MASPLRERESAREMVADVIDAARNGRGGVLFIDGEAGLGKTSLLDVARQLARPDLRVGSGQGDVMEMSLPFGVLGQAVSMLGGPELLATSVPAIGRPEQLYRLLRWLEKSEQPALLALDDLHWADSDSLELLALLARRICAVPAAVVATMRPWPERACAVAAGLVNAGLAQRVGLAPLSREASREMLSERSGRSVPDVAAETAWETCAGNPLLLEQVAVSIARGAIDPDADANWTAVGVDALLLGRFAGLPLRALQCARAASVLGVRFRPDVAADVGGLDEADAHQALEALCRSGLVEQATPGTARFVHPLFAQALYDDLPGPVRTRLHSRSFDVLVRRSLDPEAAEHALRAGLRDAAVIATLERAGRAALDVGALGTAVVQLGAAVELSGDAADSSLLLAHGAALLGCGDPIAAACTTALVLARAGVDPAVRASALRMRGRALHAAGDHVAAAACFTGAADLLMAEDPHAASETLIDQAMSMHVVLGPRGALPLAKRAIELAAGADEHLRLRADAANGYLTVMAGDPAGLSATAAAALAAHAHPRPELADPSWSWGLSTVHAHAAKYLEQFDVAVRGFRSARLAAEQLGAAEALTMSLIGEADVAARAGRLTDALELSDRASELTDLVPMGATHNAVVRFFVLLHLDRPVEAAGCRRQLETLVDERDEGISRIWLLHLQGIANLGLGRANAASKDYLLAEQIAERLGIAEPCVVPWGGRAIIAHARAGRFEDAHRVLDWLERCADRLPCHQPGIAAAFGRAEMAIRVADHRAAERLYLEALAIHESPELTLERACILLAYGDMVRRSGEPARARPLLAEALRAAESCGALAVARYAREGLSSTGGRRRRRTPDGRLTPQELRVAQLVRAGSSRRQIAERLTVSEATVRTHLQHVYAKLDIHSARELMTAGSDRLVAHDRDEADRRHHRASDGPSSAAPSSGE